MKPLLGRQLLLRLALAGAALPACGPDFTPVSYLNDLRVLAVASDPVEVGPDESLRLQPFVYLPEGQSLELESWSFCPFSLGPTTAYSCAVPACEQSLSPQADGSVVANPGELALSCAAGYPGGGAPPPGLPDEIPERVEVYFRYLAVSSGGTRRETVVRVTVWTRGPPQRPNGPPAIAAFEVDGSPLEPGELSNPVAENDEAVVRVRIDPGSLDPYVDESGRERVEEPIVSFFTTAGRFEFDRANGTDVTVGWKAEELQAGQTQADLYAVVRDLRGGVAVFGPVGMPILR